MAKLNELLAKLDQCEIPEFGKQPHLTISFLAAGKDEGVFSSFESRCRDIHPKSSMLCRGWKEETPIIYPEEKSESEFTKTLTELLNSLPRYSNVKIQSIRKQEGSRIPISVASFTYGNPSAPKISHVYIKNYEGMEKFRKKDVILPAFMAGLGIPTATVIGCNGNEFKNRLAFLQPPESVFLDAIGQTDYTEVVKDLGRETLIDSGKKVLDIMALMHVRATKEIEKLKTDYGLELDETNYQQLIEERLLSHLSVEERIKKEFEESYEKLSKIEKGIASYFCHGDFTANNIRVGKNLADYYIIDWELSRKNAFAPEDLAMFTIFTLSVREDRNAFKELEKEYFSYYIEKFNLIAESEAPSLQLSQIDFKSQKSIENLRGHLYKIGDQIWTQEKFGESDARKFRAQWHLSSFLDFIDKEIIKQREKREILANIRGKTIYLLANSQNIPYLNSILQKYSRASY